MQRFEIENIHKMQNTKDSTGQKFGVRIIRLFVDQLPLNLTFISRNSYWICVL